MSFETLAPDVEEVAGGDPRLAVLENASRKARAGLVELGSGASGTLILGADTEVVLDGAALGKPDDGAGARRRLEALSGRTHEVLTAIALLEAGGGERTGVSESRVTFRELGPETLELYLDSGEWRDRAGAYAVQGLGSILVESLEGDLSNVIGLPIGLLIELAPEIASGIS